MKTRAKATLSHDVASSPAAPTSAPATNSSPVRTTPHTRSRGPAPLLALDPNTGALPQISASTRTPSRLTIRLPRVSLPSSITSPPIPTSSIRTPIPTSPTLASTPSTPSHPPSAHPQTPAQPVYTFPPPPPPLPQSTPPPSHVGVAHPSSPISSPAPADTNPVAQSPLSGQPNPSPTRARASREALPPQYRALAMASRDNEHKLKTAPPPPPPLPAQPPAKSPAQIVTQLPVQPPTQLSPQPTITFLPPNTDFESDYGGDLMDVDTEDISTVVDSPSEGTYIHRHREANKKYRQRLKERIQNGEIDEIEAARRRERKRINARNSRARRKAMKEAAPEDGGSSSVDPVQLPDPRVMSADPTPAPGDFLLCLPDLNPPAGSYYSTTFHEILAKANSASSDSASGYTHYEYEPESASAPHYEYEPEGVTAPLPSASRSSAPLPPASPASAPHPPAFVSTSLSSASFPPASYTPTNLPPASFTPAHLPPASFTPARLPPAPPPPAPLLSAPHPIIKSRNFRDAGIMTEPIPEPPQENVEGSLDHDPIPTDLARHPHRQLTTERLREFETNPLQLIGKAFLLIVPDPGSSLGKLLLCRINELRVSADRHLFSVQFWGDRRPSEMSVERMLEVLDGGYEIDPPAVDLNTGSGPQTSGLTGRFFGALRSLAGF